MELIESRPELPRQTYQHCTRTQTSRSNSSTSLDHCNSQPVSQHAAGSVSSLGSRTSNMPAASGSLHSQTLSKNCTTSRDQQSTEDWRSNRAIPAHRSFESGVKNFESGVRSSTAGSSYVSDQQSAEDWRSNRVIPAHRSFESGVKNFEFGLRGSAPGSGRQSADDWRSNRGILSYENTTQSSSGLSHGASSTGQLLPVHYGQSHSHAVCAY